MNLSANPFITHLRLQHFSNQYSKYRYSYFSCIDANSYRPERCASTVVSPDSNSNVLVVVVQSRQQHNGGSSSSETQTISGSEATSHVSTTCPLCWCGLVQVCCSQEPQARAVSLNRLFGFHHPWYNYHHCPCAIFCCNL